MLKVIITVLLFKIVWLSGCNPAHQKEPDASVMKVYLNDSILKLTDEMYPKLTIVIDELFKESNDYYELIVTDNFIRTLRENEKYLEIKYPDNKVIETGKFGKIEYRQVFIPLSGKYTSAGQVTLFYGVDDYSSTPLINPTGQNKLKQLITEIKKSG